MGFRRCLTLTSFIVLGCSSIPQKLDPNVFYKKDLPVCVKDVQCFEGTAVLPRRDSYEFEIAPKGDAEITMAVLDTCHREFTQEATSANKTFLDSFMKFLGKKQAGWKLFYTPIPNVEDDGDCTVRINTLDRSEGKHAWAVFRFEHPKYTLPATIYCNGEVRQTNGVSVCQGKAGLSQQIQFDEPVMIEPDPGCDMPVKGNRAAYQWSITLGECGYTVKGKSGRLHDLLAIGYEGLLVRETK